MDKKDVIIIILALIIIVILAMQVYHPNEGNKVLYRTVNISPTFSLDVPASSNFTKTKVDSNTVVLNDSVNDILITSFNMKNASKLDLLEEGSQYLYTEEAYKIGAEQITLSNHTVWYNRKDNNYIAFFYPENTDDNIIIVCKDNLTMANIISSVRY